MTSFEQFARIITSSLASLVAAVFVLNYSWMASHNALEHTGDMLPAFATDILAAAPWALFVPLAVLALGVLWRKRPRLFLATMCFAWLFSLTWPLTCILAWMPVVFPILL